MGEAVKAGVPAIEFIGVDKRFPARGKAPEVLAARDVNLAIQPGEVVSLIGPSGCGKSTLLNMGAGLARPSAGTVRTPSACNVSRRSVWVSRTPCTRRSGSLAPPSA